MIIAKQSTSLTIMIGPFVDSTDAVTPESVTLANTDIKLSKNGGTFANKNSGGGTTDAAGWAPITLDATDMNTVGTIKLAVNVTGSLPVFTDIQVVETAIYDALFANAATGKLPATLATADISGTLTTDVTAILEDTSTTLPNQISGIGTSGGSAMAIDASESNELGGITGVTASTTFVGTATNDYTDTSMLDGVYHSIVDDADAIDVVYRFNTGGGTSPVGMAWTGYLTGGNDACDISAWNHVGAAWEKIGAIAGTAGETNQAVELVLYERHQGGSGAELGNIYLRLHCSGQSSPKIGTDQIVATYSVTSRSVGYANGSVWVDMLNGSPGTELFVNGVADAPSNSITDAASIAGSLNLKRLFLVNGSSVTLSIGYENWTFDGSEWDVLFDSQSIDGSNFTNAEVRGISTGVAEFTDCIFAATTIEGIVAYNCSFVSTVTMNAAGNYRYINCQSGVPGSGSPTFALVSGAGNINAEWRRWSGGIAFTGMLAGDVITVSGELGTVDLGSPTGGTVEIRGTYKAITNIGSATVNTQGALSQTDADYLQLLTDASNASTKGDSIDGYFSTGKVDVGLINGSSPAAARLSLASGSMTTGSVETSTTAPDTVSFSTDITEPTANHYVGQVIKFLDGNLAGQAVVIEAYALVSGEGNFTVSEMTDTPQAADSFIII